MITLESLSAMERTLLIQLLECEESELPVEIRHTRNTEVRADLHDRLQLVQSLLSRFRETIVGQEIS
jgi:hypothetical protein